MCAWMCNVYFFVSMDYKPLSVWLRVAIGRPPPSFGPFYSLAVTLTQNTMRVVGTPNPHPFKPQAFWNDLMLAERAQLASSTRLRLKDAGRGLLCIGTSDPVWRVGSCQQVGKRGQDGRLRVCQSIWDIGSAACRSACFPRPIHWREPIPTQRYLRLLYSSLSEHMYRSWEKVANFLHIIY